MQMRFADITATRPEREALAARYAALDASLATAPEATLREWDALRRVVEGWSALAHLRFAQDTTDAAAKAEREYADALAPVVQGHDTDLKRRILAEVDPALVARLCGAHAAALWRCDITTFAPEIADDLEEESRLGARYTALLAGAKKIGRAHV